MDGEVVSDGNSSNSDDDVASSFESDSEASGSDCLRQSEFGSKSQSEDSDTGMLGNAHSCDAGRIGVLGGEMVDDTLGLCVGAEPGKQKILSVGCGKGGRERRVWRSGGKGAGKGEGKGEGGGKEGRKKGEGEGGRG